MVVFAFNNGMISSFVRLHKTFSWVFVVSFFKKKNNVLHCIRLIFAKFSIKIGFMAAFARREKLVLNYDYCFEMEKKEENLNELIKLVVKCLKKE